MKAKDSDVYITGVRTASHYRSNIYEGTYRVLVRNGTCYGNELSKVCCAAGFRVQRVGGEGGGAAAACSADSAGACHWKGWGDIREAREQGNGGG